MDIVLTVNSIAHFLTDAVCAALIFGSVAAEGDVTAAVLIYNTLAFSTQCVVGLFTDRLLGHEKMAGFSLAAMALSLLLPLPWLLRIIIAGLGNSVFHVAAGTVTLKNSGARAGPLGVFVAPGAVGLALGSIYPAIDTYFAVGALLVCVPMIFCPDHTGKPEEASSRISSMETPWLAVAALLIAVAVRAIGGTVASFSWKTTSSLSLLLVLFVFAGKAAGGYICDRLGAKNTAKLSIPLAAVLIAFCSEWMFPSLAGQLLLNLSMPVTLWLLYRAMPDSPGLAFGLAASALWPGTIAGSLIALSGAALWACILISFLFGLFAILLSEKKIMEAEK